MLVHVKADYLYDNISVNEIDKEDIVKVLGETQDDEQSYVVKLDEENTSLQELQDYDKDDIIEFLYDIEVTGNLIAKYVPFDID